MSPATRGPKAPKIFNFGPKADQSKKVVELIDDLNQTGILITDLNKVVGSIAIGGQILQSTSETLNNLIPVLNTAIAAIPPPGLPGAIVSSVNVINNFAFNVHVKLLILSEFL
jgi:hypothetical protein